jgi:hypothetical protein
MPENSRAQSGKEFEGILRKARNRKGKMGWKKADISCVF